MDKLANKPNKLKTYVKYRNGEPVAYLYGEPGMVERFSRKGGFEPENKENSND